MMKLLIKDLAGEYCATYDDGIKVFRTILPLLKDGEKVELNFDGVNLTSSSFFNAAIGNLLQEFEVGNQNSPVSFSNITSRDKFIMEKTLKALRAQNAQPA